MSNKPNTNTNFNPENYPNDFHICYNGKYNTYGSIIHNQPFYVIGENGKETEIGRYDACTRCYEVLKLKFNANFPDKYKTNIHKLFKKCPKAIFFYKDEVMTGEINKNAVPLENETFKEFRKRHFKFLKEANYAYQGKVSIDKVGALKRG